MMKISKWYDPISQRWIIPRETMSAAISPQAIADDVLEPGKRSEAERIWHALIDCCARL
ncbi:MAG: hypothetical protein ABUL53_06435 [Bradyrhizobium guangdongense]